ncbi:MAG: GvpL/GvpF family gas vesicle protein [Solirubrobacteraceae bacterium]
MLSAVADAEAPQLIEEVTAGAYARARAILEDALVDELLRAAGEGAAPRPPAPQGSAWWAYCVLPSQNATELASGLAGIEPGSRVEAVVEGELAALVSQVPLAEYGDERLRQHLEDITWLERTACAHEAVQEAVLQREALVPLRLCTLYRDPDSVRRALRENAEVFTANLAAVQGCAEWGVKVFLERQPAADAPPAATPASGEASSSGTDYLAGRQRARNQAAVADELCAQCTDEVHRAVAAVARQDRLNPVQRPEAHGRDAEMVLNGAYLVERDRGHELHGVVSELEANWTAHGLAVELTGPWPPYNFVSDSAGMVS